jgi:hypothetical protein
MRRAIATYAALLTGVLLLLFAIAFAYVRSRG